ncbi:MAG: hypothetical protein ACK5Y2_07850 [Bdellovibrionales bacterium]
MKSRWPILLGATLLFLGLGLWKVFDLKGALPAPSILSQASQPRSFAPSGSQSPKESDDSSPLLKRFTTEAEQISQLDSNPEATELRLRRLSESLQKSELEELRSVILNSQALQDHRFLALTLLAWSKQIQVGDWLSEIASSPFDPFLNPGRQGDFETILRMRAVEGLGELPLPPEQQKRHLSSIVQKSAQSQVVDRAQRALWALAGQAPTPAEQDQEALEKVLSKERN